MRIGSYELQPILALITLLEAHAVLAAAAGAYFYPAEGRDSTY